VRRGGAPRSTSALAEADGFYEAISVHETPVAVTGSEVLIQGHVTSGTGCGASSTISASG